MSMDLIVLVCDVPTKPDSRKRLYSYSLLQRSYIASQLHKRQLYSGRQALAETEYQVLAKHQVSVNRKTLSYSDKPRITTVTQRTSSQSMSIITPYESRTKLSTATHGRNIFDITLIQFVSNNVKVVKFFIYQQVSQEVCMMIL